MARVLLFHWKEEEAEERVDRLRSWGHAVAWRGMRGKEEVRVTSARQFGAEVVVFDLSRMPVYSKYQAELIRKAKSTAHIPFVFVEGQAEKVKELKAIYPGEKFTKWGRLEAVLKAMKPGVLPRALPEQTKPERQLWQKLGMKDGMRVWLGEAPQGFERALGQYPETVEFVEGAQAAKLYLQFLEDMGSPGEALEQIVQQARQAPVWVFYAKGVLKMNDLRNLLLDAGLVDYKICSVNERWAGILVREKRA
ncbi:MAG: hypothetical protein NW208_16575 [Bryobacter sp.]|nr:hypothetical protein [Bryobacter sp.]